MNPWKRKKEPPDPWPPLAKSPSVSFSLALSQTLFICQICSPLVIAICPSLGYESPVRASSQMISFPETAAESLGSHGYNFAFCNALGLVILSDLVPLTMVMETDPSFLLCALARLRVQFTTPVLILCFSGFQIRSYWLS